MTPAPARGTDRNSVRRPRRCALALRVGAVVLASLREAADLVDRILRGARPADLPVRQIRSVTVTLNLGLARELGIELPVSLRIRADEVIE